MSGKPAGWQLFCLFSAGLEDVVLPIGRWGSRLTGQLALHGATPHIHSPRHMHRWAELSWHVACRPPEEGCKGPGVLPGPEHPPALGL